MMKQFLEVALTVQVWVIIALMLIFWALVELNVFAQRIIAT